MTEQGLDDCKTFVRSVLQSSKSGVLVDKLCGEYSELVGKQLPFREYGFYSAREFILSKMKDVAVLKINEEGQQVFIAIPHSKTEHLERLIEKQRPKKKPKKKHGQHAGRVASSRGYPVNARRSNEIRSKCLRPPLRQCHLVQTHSNDDRVEPSSRNWSAVLETQTQSMKREVQNFGDTIFMEKTWKHVEKDAAVSTPQPRQFQASVARQVSLHRELSHVEQNTPLRVTVMSNTACKNTPLKVTVMRNTREVQRCPKITFSPQRNELPPRFCKLPKQQNKLSVFDRLGKVQRGIIIEKRSLPREWRDTVYICYIENSSNLFLRMGREYSDELKKLENSFSEVTLEPLTYFWEGLFCLACYDVETSKDGKQLNKYRRVEISEVLKDGMVRASYIDHGGWEIFQDTKLFNIPEGDNLPCQAINCFMENLEDFSNDLLVSKILQQKVLGKTFRATSKLVNQKYSIQLEDIVVEDPMKIKLNELIARMALELHLPKNAGEFVDGSICHVSFGGFVYLQFEGPGRNLLHRLLNRINSSYIEKSEACVAFNTWRPRMLALAKDTAGNWMRAEILEIVSKSELLVQFVDCGFVRLVNVTDVRPLPQDIAWKLENIPHQAVCCRIKGLYEDLVKWTDSANDRLAKVAQEATTVEVGNMENNGKYWAADIRLKDDRRSSFFDLMIRGFGSLWNEVTTEAVKISSGNEVYITESDDLENIKGYPVYYHDKLKSLMDSMNNEYAKPEADFLPTVESLAVNDLYAVRVSDRSWFRGRITRILDKTTVNVELTDFGHMCENLSLNRLRHLSDRFRYLPFLSLHMKLAGICQNKTWNAEKTAYLRKLCLSKTFSMYIKNNDSSKCPLSVVLVDMGVCDNPFVHQILIEEKLAISLKNQCAL